MFDRKISELIERQMIIGAYLLEVESQLVNSFLPADVRTQN